MTSNGSNIKITSGSGDFKSSKAGTKGTGKDFKKVLSKEGGEERRYTSKNEEVKDDKGVAKKNAYADVAGKLEEEEQVHKKPAVSLFDLAKTQETEESESAEAIGEQLGEEDIPIAELSEEMRKESLSALFKGYGTKEKLDSLQMGVAGTKGPHAKENVSPGAGFMTPPMESTTVASGAEKSAGTSPKEHVERKTSEQPWMGPQPAKGKYTKEFPQEQPDLAAINPLAGETSQASAQIQRSTPPPPAPSQIHELVQQIIDKLYLINVYGQTDTLITLKHPPLFEGATVVLKAYDTAKGEFNIAFENLTQAAKHVLDMQENQAALKLALEQKGYTVHIIITTTQAETLGALQPNPTGKEGQERGQQGSHRERGRDEEEQES